MIRSDGAKAIDERHVAMLPIGDTVQPELRAGRLLFGVERLSSVNQTLYGVVELRFHSLRWASDRDDVQGTIPSETSGDCRCTFDALFAVHEPASAIGLFNIGAKIRFRDNRAARQAL
jgi:hypothetical protein